MKSRRSLTTTRAPHHQHSVARQLVKRRTETTFLHAVFVVVFFFCSFSFLYRLSTSQLLASLRRRHEESTACSATINHSSGTSMSTGETKGNINRKRPLTYRWAEIAESVAMPYRRVRCSPRKKAGHVSIVVAKRSKKKMEIKLHCYHHRHRWFGDHISIISLANGPGWTRIDKNPSNLFLEREEEREKKTNYVGTLHTQHDTTKYSNHQQIVHTRTIRSLPFVVFFFSSCWLGFEFNISLEKAFILLHCTVLYRNSFFAS